MALDLQDDNVSPAQVQTTLVIVLLCITWFTTLLRLWVRGSMTKSVGYDDAAMLGTLLLFTLFCCFMLVLISRGGMTRSDFAQTLPRTITYLVLCEVFYILCTTSLRMALGLFFLRVLVKRWQRLFLKTILVISTIAGILYSLLAIFQCGLPNTITEKALNGGRGCISKGTSLGTGYTYGAISIIADWSFVIMPLFMLHDLSMNKKSKISVAVVMVLGAVGSVASAVRMVYLKGIFFTPNFFLDGANLAIWSTIEPGTGIAAGSLATLRPLVRLAVDFVREKGTSAYGSTRPRQDSRPQTQIGYGNFEEASRSYIMTSVTADPKRHPGSRAGSPATTSSSSHTLNSRLDGNMSNDWTDGDMKNYIHKCVEVEVRTE